MWQIKMMRVCALLISASVFSFAVVLQSIEMMIVFGVFTASCVLMVAGAMGAPLGLVKRLVAAVAAFVLFSVSMALGSIAFFFPTLFFALLATMDLIGYMRRQHQ